MAGNLAVCFPPDFHHPAANFHFRNRAGDGVKTNQAGGPKPDPEPLGAGGQAAARPVHPPAHLGADNFLRNAAIGLILGFSMKQPVPAGLKILVVDDEPTVLETLQNELIYLGHDVQTASTGAAALDILAQGAVDLVITDYFMQGMKGDELARQIKERRPELPILMATAYAEVVKADDQYQGLVDHLLVKPFGPSQLQAAVGQAVSRRRPPAPPP